MNKEEKIAHQIIDIFEKENLTSIQCSRILNTILYAMKEAITIEIKNLIKELKNEKKKNAE